MIEVKAVRTKKDKKIFLEFANKLYKGDPYFVPPLYISEKDIFKKITTITTSAKPNTLSL